MARPNLGSEDRRDHFIRVRLTLAEKTRLFTLAKSTGLNPSDFVRSHVLSVEPQSRKSSPERQALIAALGQLGKIGSNFNQIARALNRRAETGELIGVSAETITFTLSGLDALVAGLRKLLENDGHSR